MALHVETKSTTNAQALLALIIKATKKGNLPTWDLNPAGGFVHTPKQWNLGAYFEATIQNASPSRLNFHYRIDAGQGPNLTAGTFGTLHGRFLEALIHHFNSHIENVTYVDRR